MTNELKTSNYIIYFNLFISAKSEKKLNLVLNRLFRNCHKEIQSLKYERYWKDNSLYKTSFQINTETSSMAPAVISALNEGHNFAEKWIVGKPLLINNITWQFRGDAVAGSLHEVKLAEFILSN